MLAADSHDLFPLLGAIMMNHSPSEVFIIVIRMVIVKAEHWGELSI